MIRLVLGLISILLLVLVVACGTARVEQTTPAEPVETPAPAVAEASMDYPNKPHHQDGEVSCVDCHGVATPDEAAPVEACLECHGSYEDLAEATFTGEHSPNPHESPHYGNDQDCGLCHYEHEESENMCGDCHEWAPVVP